MNKSITLHYSVATDIGPRAENQDNYLIRKPCGQWCYLKNSQEITGVTQLDQKHWWRFAVFDGMGGHQGGREISEKAAELLAAAPTATNREALKNLIFSVHKQLYKEFCALKAGTTLLIAEINVQERIALIAHVGDSRIFFRKSQKNNWTQLTEDHIAFNFLARARDLPPLGEVAFNMPLAQAFGYGSYSVFPEKDALRKEFSENLRLDISSPPSTRDDVKKFALQEGSQLLLITDGIWHTKENYALPLIKEFTHAQDFLHQAQLAGARDNMTALAITFTGKS